MRTGGILLALLLASGSAAAQGELQRCRAIADPDARLGCYDALADTAAAPSPAPAAPHAPRPGDFGRPAAALVEEAPHLDARIAGPVREWKTGTVFVLDNGQRWKVTEGSGFWPGIPDNPPVVIRRSFFGAYWLEIDGISQKIKVRRIN